MLCTKQCFLADFGVSRITQGTSQNSRFPALFSQQPLSFCGGLDVQCGIVPSHRLDWGRWSQRRQADLGLKWAETHNQILHHAPGESASMNNSGNFSALVRNPRWWPREQHLKAQANDELHRGHPSTNNQLERHPQQASPASCVGEYPWSLTAPHRASDRSRTSKLSRFEDERYKHHRRQPVHRHKERPWQSRRP